jgi:hypothetical protein
MCDYSLHHYQNRLALRGETLVVYRFPSSTLGLASPADLQAIADEKANRRRPRFWLTIVDFFSAPIGEKVTWRFLGGRPCEMQCSACVGVG